MTFPPTNPPVDESAVVESVPRAAGGDGVEPLGPGGEPSAAHRRRRWRSWMSGAIAGAVTGAVVAGLITLATDARDQTQTATASTTTAAASGVIITAEGLTLTNAHVESGVTQVNITLNDGRKFRASVSGSDASHDIALLHIDGASGLTVARLGSSAMMTVGDDVVAIGNALDLGGKLSVTRSIVSAVERTQSDGTTTLEHLIQTDAAISSGNSGGPLLNADGEVIGINTAIIQNSENMGFAIAIDSIKDLIPQLGA